MATTLRWHGDKHDDYTATISRDINYDMATKWRRHRGQHDDDMTTTLQGHGNDATLPPHRRQTLLPHRHHIAATLLPHCRHIAATLPPYCRHIGCHNCHKTLFLPIRSLFGPKHDLIGRNKVLWQLWQPMWATIWRQYGGDVAAVWQQCGGDVAAMWWRCGGDVVAAIWRQRGIVFMSSPCCCHFHVLAMSSPPSSCWYGCFIAFHFRVLTNRGL